MKIHAGTAFCPECHRRQGVEYDLQTEETTCKHCGETIVPPSGHLSHGEKDRLAAWWRCHQHAEGDR
jgi:hypothetical protein